MLVAPEWLKYSLLDLYRTHPSFPNCFYKVFLWLPVVVKIFSWLWSSTIKGTTKSFVIILYYCIHDTRTRYKRKGVYYGGQVTRKGSLDDQKTTHWNGCGVYLESFVKPTMKLSVPNLPHHTLSEVRHIPLWKCEVIFPPWKCFYGMTAKHPAVKVVLLSRCVLSNRG